jgi:hypothetical protein
MLFVIIIIFCLLLAIWLAGVTIFTLRLSAHYNHLIKDTSKRTLQSVLENLMVQQDATKKDIALLKSTCDTIIADGKLHIQKIGLLRFNPFKDTGGDQSFILALVDGNDTGVVISGLYSRSGTRWYAKKIVKGEGIEHELSDEEKQAVKQAKQLTHEK